MLKENKRLKKQHYREENLRIQRLVKLAYALDPRVKELRALQEQRRLEAKKAERERLQKEQEE